MKSYFLALPIVLSLVMVSNVSPSIAETKMECASVKNMAYPLPDNPSFAIMLFDNINEDPEMGYLSEGITVWLTDNLARESGVFVIAPGSTFTYKGKPVSIKNVAEELGVRYVVDGGIKKTGDQLRVSARLTDALEGNLVWSGHYERHVNDIFMIQDDCN